MNEIKLRPPNLNDGMSVFRLVESCPPLDSNSSYCNFLQCSHFSETSIAAEINGELVGFVSAYILPKQPNTLFVWQVAVSEAARGQGLASRMLLGITAREYCSGVSYVETTITKDNKASWALFGALAATLDSDQQSTLWLDSVAHFERQHDSENILRIGPFKTPGIKV